MIRSPGQLDRFLSRSLSWRKKELTTLKFAVDTAPASEQKVLLRAATTLLYAHWEGFIKEAGTGYLELVARQRLTLGDIKASFLAIAVRSQILQCAYTAKTSIHKLLVERIKGGSAEPANVPWRGTVKTRSNLTAPVLEEIINTLDLDYAPFQLKAKVVIDRLVKARNQIAHGAGVPVPAADYVYLHGEIIGLMDEFKNQVQSAATTRKYKI